MVAKVPGKHLLGEHARLNNLQVGHVLERLLDVAADNVLMLPSGTADTHNHLLYIRGTSWCRVLIETA